MPHALSHACQAMPDYTRWIAGRQPVPTPSHKSRHEGSHLENTVPTQAVHGLQQLPQLTPLPCNKQLTQHLQVGDAAARGRWLGGEADIQMAGGTDTTVQLHSWCRQQQEHIETIKSAKSSPTHITPTPLCADHRRMLPCRQSCPHSWRVYVGSELLCSLLE